MRVFKGYAEQNKAVKGLDEVIILYVRASD